MIHRRHARAEIVCLSTVGGMYSSLFDRVSRQILLANKTTTYLNECRNRSNFQFKMLCLKILSETSLTVS